MSPLPQPLQDAAQAAAAAIGGSLGPVRAPARQGEPFLLPILPPNQAKPLWLEVAAAPCPAWLQHGPLGISYRKLDDPTAEPLAHDAARALAAALPLDLQVAAWFPQPVPLPELVPLTAREALQRLGDEGRRLAPWNHAYGQVFGQEPAWALQHDPLPTVVVRLPRPPQHLATSAELLFDATRGLLGRPRIEEWLAQLGFRTASDGVLDTVPTPQGFLRAVQATWGQAPGFRPLLVPSHALVLPVGRWLRHLLAGEIPINVSSAAFYRAVRPLRSPLALRLPQARTLWCGHFLAIGHDMGVHALITHRVPPAEVARLARPVLARLARLKVAMGPLVPGPLLAFFEEDLHQHCLRLWKYLGDPADFQDAWHQHRAELEDRLQVRLAQVDERVVHGVFLGRKHGW